MILVKLFFGFSVVVINFNFIGASARQDAINVYNKIIDGIRKTQVNQQLQGVILDSVDSLFCLAKESFNSIEKIKQENANIILQKDEAFKKVKKERDTIEKELLVVKQELQESKQQIIYLNTRVVELEKFCTDADKLRKELDSIAASDVEIKDQTKNSAELEKVVDEVVAASVASS